jgi:tetratricopeptide (TPR) repeat protein
VQTFEAHRPERRRQAIATLQRWEFLKDQRALAFDPSALIDLHNRAYGETDDGHFRRAEALFKDVLLSFVDEVGFREALFETFEGHLVRELPIADVGMLEHLDLMNQTVLFLRTLPWWPEVGVACRSYGRNLHFQGRLAEAGVLYRQALSIWRVLGPNHPNLLESTISYSEVLTAQGEMADAHVVLTEAASLIQGSSQIADSDVIDYLLAGAEYMIGRGELRHAKSAATSALTKCERSTTDVRAARGATLEILGYIALESGQHEQALGLLTKAKEARASVLGSAHPLLASCATKMARCHIENRDLDNARLLIDEAIALAGAELADAHPISIDILCARADYLNRTDNRPAAAERFDRAISTVYENYHPNHPRLAAIERLRSQAHD